MSLNISSPSHVLTSSMELLAQYNGTSMQSNANEAGDTLQRKHFLVVSKDNVNPAARVIHLESPVSDIALGAIEGVNREEKTDICVIGLQDGRVLIALLPFATVVRAVGLHDTFMHVPENGANVNVNITSSYSISNTGAGGGGLKTHRTAGSKTERSAVGFTARSTTTTPRTALSVAAGLTQRAASALSVNSGPSASNSVNGGDSINDPYDGIPEVEEEGEDEDVDAVQNTVDVLDEAACRVLRLHSGAVTRCAISATGYWIFTAGADGSVFMLATSARAREFVEVPERLGALENGLVVTDKKQLESLRGRILEVDNLLEEKQTENERALMRVSEQKNLAVQELETRMKRSVRMCIHAFMRMLIPLTLVSFFTSMCSHSCISHLMWYLTNSREVSKRDDIIIRGREDHVKHSRQLQEESDNQKAYYEERIAELEMAYERKLAQESLYLEKMKQAYDEFVVHARLDLKGTSRKGQEGDLLGLVGLFEWVC